MTYLFRQLRAATLLFGVVTALCGTPLAKPIAAQPAEFDPTAVPQFQDGDVVNFVGDSITHGGHWHTYITDLYRTRFPDRQIRYANTGVSGDVVGQALARFDQDIAPIHANIAVVMLGMNDVGSSLYPATGATPDILAKRQTLVEKYIDGMRLLIASLRDAGTTTVVLIEPSPYDQTATIAAANNPERNDLLKTCSDRLASLATEEHTYLVDFHGPMTRIDLERQRKDPKYTLIGSDRVHPTSPGSLVMASLFLSAQHVPALISNISISQTSQTCDLCALSHVVKTKNRLVFDVAETRLPYAIDPAAVSALPLPGAPILPGDESLSVGGLPSGSYALSIDGTAIESFTAKQLGSGVNLATLENTPQAIQARRVMQLDEQVRQQRVTLRDLAVVRYTVLLAAKIDPNDGTATNAYLAQYIVDQKNNVPGHNAFVAGLIERYKQNLANEPALRTAIALETRQAEKEVRPVLHHYELSKAN